MKKVREEKNDLIILETVAELKMVDKKNDTHNHENRQKEECDVNQESGSQEEKKQYLMIGKHNVYYKQAGRKESHYLHTTKRFSPSLEKFFTKYGRLVCEKGNQRTYAMTSAEFFRAKARGHHDNHVLNSVEKNMLRMIDYVLVNEIEREDTKIPCQKHEDKIISIEQFERLCREKDFSVAA